MEQKQMAKILPDEPKPAYFGDAEAFGDGCSNAYLGGSIGNLTDALDDWANNPYAPDTIRIFRRMMTDAEVAALPEM